MRKFSLLAVLIVVATFVCSAQVPFTTLDTTYFSGSLVIPQSPLVYDTLFIGNFHNVYNPGNGQTALAKQNHDFLGLVPINSRKAWLIVNHEITNTRNTKLGDGGGQTVFQVRQKNGRWKVAKSLYNKEFINVDFSPLGGTNINCGGATTPTGKTLTAEEYPINSNAQLFNNNAGFSDTMDYTIPAGNGMYSGLVIKKWQQLGWMTEVNPATATATKKYYGMGRFSHEGGACMKDGKTVYLTDDFTPGIFFKFVADVANDYTAGQLYAYKQGVGGVGGEWLTLPMQFDSLSDIRNVAVRKGASMFTRLEWVVPNGSGAKLYIAETGADNVDYTSSIAVGGTPSYASTLRDVANGGVQDNKHNDYYGRVLEFTPATNQMNVLIEGGYSTDGKTNFSNPDGLAVGKVKGKEFLVINEDLVGLSFGRVPANNGGKVVCEVFFLDLDIKNAKVDDLKRFAIGPLGSETTGGVFSKNGDTYFLNIQHPSSSNPFPFNNSCTVAISGFSNFVEALIQDEEAVVANITTFNELNAGKEEAFAAFPNPASREVRFNKTTDIAVFNMAGQQVMVERNVNRLDISGLTAGVYFLQTIDGQTQKLIVE